MDKVKAALPALESRAIHKVPLTSCVRACVRANGCHAGLFKKQVHSPKL